LDLRFRGVQSLAICPPVNFLSAQIGKN